VDVIDFTQQANAAGHGRRDGFMAAPLILGALALWTGGALGLLTRGGGAGDALAVVAVVPEGASPVLIFEVEPQPVAVEHQAATAPATAAPTPEPVATSASGNGASQQPTGEAATVTPNPGAGPTAPAPPAIPGSPVVWSNGDSTSLYMSAALFRMVEGSGGRAATAPAYVVSSGLLSPGLYDWPANLATEMALHRPDIAVFMVGANDANGAAANPEGYRALVGAVMDQLQAPGRRVAWVGQPPMGRADLAASIPVVNRIFREEAAKRPWVTFVDVFPVLADASGGYSAALPGPDGTLVRMRADDGVHLTPAAGELLARAVFEALFPGVPVP
jgi:hypothetical protein